MISPMASVHIRIDGRVYEGQFVSGLRQGQGQLRWANGDFYQGASLLTPCMARYLIWANKDRYQASS